MPLSSILTPTLPACSRRLLPIHLSIHSQDRKRVTRDYMTGWMLPDIVSSLPMDLIFLVFRLDGQSALKSTKGFKLLRLIRITKVAF